MSSQTRSQLVRDLHELGYFEAVSPLALDSLMDLALNSDMEEPDEEPLFDRRTHRVASIDAEDLSEGFAHDILRQLEPYLISRGVRFSDVNLTEIGTDYTLTVDGVPYSLGLRRDTHNWHSVATRFVGVVSRLLEAAGSAERAYLVYLGHESLVLFLTPEMFRVIQASPAVHPMFKPTSSNDPHTRGPSLLQRVRFVINLMRMMTKR